jgi:Anti-sigma-K factor rskA/Putative zinc-finger
MSTAHEDIQSLLAPYALHALDDAEMQLVESHIADCPECADELADLLDTASMVTLTEVEAPPAQLWSRIETGMRAESKSEIGQLPIESMSQRPNSAAVAMSAPVIDLDAARSARVGRERRLSLRSALIGAIAAAAVVVPLTASVVSPSTPSIAALAAKAANAKGSQRIEMSSPEKKRLGDVIIDANGNGYVRNETLAELPAGKTYQLWTIVDGAPVSAGLLGRSPKTSAFSANGKIQAVAISIENESGAVSPSTPIGVAAVV